jgi:uncharacterized protein YjbJ (UPF0337 family)
MYRSEFEGKWRQIRGQARQWWSKLTEADLERVSGNLEEFFTILQAKYGFTRATAEEELNQRMTQLEAKTKHAKSGGQPLIPDIVEATWAQMHSQAREWWGKLSDDQLEKTAGKAVAIFGLLQAEYGYSRERAEAELIRRIKEYEITQQETPAPISLFVL